MSFARGVRPLVCLLVAVSTAIGAVVPVRACACAVSARATPTEQKPAPQAKPAAPAAKSCCAAGSKRSCCRAAAASPCCAEPPRTDTPPAPGEQPGCTCVRCDCEPPQAPTTPPAPADSTTDLGEHLALVAAVLPGFVPPPAVAATVAAPAPTPPPADLVISLSRLTC